jgi:hypothetical protein
VAKGGDLSGDFAAVDFVADQDYAEVGSDGEGLGEECDDLVRSGGGGYVVIFGRQAEQQIADASAGEERLMAGVAQRSGDGVRCAVLWGRRKHRP